LCDKQCAEDRIDSRGNPPEAALLAVRLAWWTGLVTGALREGSLEVLPGR
jgi:hypothetical protein